MNDLRNLFVRVRIEWKGLGFRSLLIVSFSRRSGSIQWRCELLARTCLIKNLAVSFSLLSRRKKMWFWFFVWLIWFHECCRHFLLSVCCLSQCMSRVHVDVDVCDLQVFWADNPRNLQLLRHDKSLHTIKVKPHLRNVPDYLGMMSTCISCTVYVGKYNTLLKQNVLWGCRWRDGFLNPVLNCPRLMDVEWR